MLHPQKNRTFTLPPHGFRVLFAQDDPELQKILRKLAYLNKVGNLRRMRIQLPKREIASKWNFATSS
ncbi:MAG: hypothetical protein LLG04_18545 [Parachlamydia sp.]|nr:hypothetical protein [Parachlamydia sp.]